MFVSWWGANKDGGKIKGDNYRSMSFITQERWNPTMKDGDCFR